MNERAKLSMKGYVLLALLSVLIVVSIAITSRLLTADYPTHSDAFYMGVECGGLVVLLLGCLVLICLLFYLLGVSLVESE